jgi:hypothetical protein
MVGRSFQLRCGFITKALQKVKGLSKLSKSYTPVLLVFLETFLAFSKSQQSPKTVFFATDAPALRQAGKARKQ